MFDYGEPMDTAGAEEAMDLSRVDLPEKALLEVLLQSLQRSNS